MATHKSLVIGVACMVAVICGSIGMGGRSTIAKEPQAKTLIAMAYKTGDLPVWKEGGTSVDHSILIALLKANIGDDAWDDSQSIVSYVQNQSLVVEATEENHAIIKETLDQLRIDQFKRSMNIE